MSPEIVHRFEPVQIEIDEAERRILPVHRAEEFFAGAVKPAPVGNARQAVRHGHADGLEFVFHDTGQIPEGRNVIIREGAGNGVDQAQRAGHRAVGQVHRLAGVEPDVGLTGDQGIVTEPLISSCVVNNEGPLLQNGMPAERDVTRGFAHADALAGVQNAHRHGYQEGR